MASPAMEGEAVLDGERPALIPPGEYQLRFDYHETCVMFGRAPKLVLWFTVITPGAMFGNTRVPAFYNIRRLIGRPARHGRFKVGFKSGFLRDYFRLFTTPASRLDRIPMSAFKTSIIVGKVRTVERGSDQTEIPEPLRYSVIDELLRTEQP
jgi:hypothetical protein